MIAAEDEGAFAKTMEHLHRECGPEDARAVGRVLRQGLVAREPASADFPEYGGDEGRTPYVPSRRLDVELAIQRDRLAAADAKAADAVRLVGTLNAAMLRGDDDDIERLFAEHRARFGVSLMVALKAISLRNSKRSGEYRLPDDAPVLEPFRIPVRQVTTGAFDGTSGSDRNYVTGRRSFVHFVERNRLDHGDAAIVTDLLTPLKTSRFGLAHRLHAYSRRSILDVVAFLFRARAILDLDDRLEDAALVDEIIPDEVRSAWETTFVDVGADQLQAVVGTPDQFCDLSLFSHLPAWSEYPALFAYRLRVEKAVGARLDGLAILAPKSASLLVKPKETVAELLTEPALIGVPTDARVPVGGFHRTIALVASVEAGGLAVPNGEHLSRLLDRTIDVALLLSVGELDAFLPPRPDDLLYEYMRCALLNDAEGGPSRNHAVRRALQRIVDTSHDGDIVRFVTAVDSADGHVARHFFNLCSETFLTSLYKLYPDADGVMEAQTRLLEWWGANEEDGDAVAKARSHRLLIRLRKVRGSIDETRIYVDPLRMIEWIQEKLEDDLRSLAPLADEILADASTALNLRDPVGNAVKPRLRLLKLLDRCYAEFCNNKIHGVASYIGRRIRHGALHGHLSLEMQPTIERIVGEFRTLAPEFADFLKQWARDFDESVQEFARSRVHVRSRERPRGLIVAEIDEPEKATTATAVISAVAAALRDKPQTTHWFALILDYCWLFFEVDLKRARSAIEELRRAFVIGVDEHMTGRPDLDTRITESIRELNAALGGRFEMARSWLTRPTNFSPSASVGLLIDAVLDEVNQRHPCNPDVDLSRAGEIDLIGRGFHFFYDALYILVVNAAKYGRPGGRLSVGVESSISEDERHILLSVTIGSQFASGERDRRILDIDAAMTAEVGDAMNRDGQTGLRKLKGLVEESDEITHLSAMHRDDAVEFTIRMRFLRS